MQYLTILRKAEFVDLFKYGRLYVRKAAKFEGKIEDLGEDEQLFQEVTSQMNVFDYAFSYLLVHFNSDAECSSNFELFLPDVIALYAFNDDAKREFGLSFDSRIQVRVSPWAEKFNNLQQELQVKQAVEGVNNLWRVLELSEADKQRCAEIIGEEIVAEVFRELFANERPAGDLSPWVYLLRYERHSLYPNNKKGYFCDFIHAFMNYMKKQELPGEVAEKTNAYSQLTSENIIALIDVLCKSPLSEFCRKEVPVCNFHVVGPLFLFMKSLCMNGFRKTDEIEAVTKYSKEYYGFDFSVVVYLLGLALGYDGTYDCYYDSIQLPIFEQPQVEVSLPVSQPVAPDGQGHPEAALSEEEKIAEVRPEITESADAGVAENAGAEPSACVEAVPEEVPEGKPKKPRKTKTAGKEGQTEKKRGRKSDAEKQQDDDIFSGQNN